MKKAHKRIAVFAACLISGILLMFADDHITDIIAGMFFGFSLIALARVIAPRRGRNLKLPPPPQSAPRTVENRLLEKAEAAVAEETVAVQATPLGSEYRRKHWMETETAVDEMLDMFIDTISAKLSCCTIAIFFPTSNDSYALRRYATKNEFIDRKALIVPQRGLLGSLIKEGLRPFYEPNFTNKNATLYYYDEEHDFKPEENIRSIMVSPIEADGEARGILLVDSTNENAFSHSDHDFLNRIAKLTGQAVYYAYLNTEHSLDYRRLAAMSSIEKDFWKDLEFDAVMDKMCGIIPHAVPCDRLTVSLKDEDKMTASVVRVYGENSEGFLKLNFRLDDDASKTIAGLAYSRDYGFFRNFNEEREEHRYAENEPVSGNRFGSFMVVPFGVDTLKGLIMIESVRKDVFTNFNVDLLSRIGTSAGLALEKIFIIRKADALATHDALTGLYNRRQFLKILTTKTSAYARYKKPVSLALCDIDHFKKLNDTYGHPFGDEVLKGVAAKLEECIRIDVDAVARFGGEEFVLIFDQTDTEAAKESLERIRVAIEEMTFKTTDGQTVQTHMSFGVATYPDHSREINDLISKADKALYSAKQNGRNRVEVYWGLQPNAAPKVVDN